MQVKRLVLTDFRNYPNLDADFSEDKRIFLTGENGVGKTNLIEAIYYLTLGRSFKKTDDESLIRDGADSATVYLTFHDERNGEDHALACTITHQGKTFAYDGQKVRSMTKVLGKLLTVYYDPGQVFLFREEPEERRRLFDAELSLLSGDYLYALGRYKKLIRQRNAALSKNGDPEIISVLKDQLINQAYRIVNDRQELTKRLNPMLKQTYQELFRKDTRLELVYQTNCPLETDEKVYVDKAQKLFEQNRSYENIRQTTVIGPHRDNWMALLNGKDIAGYGSQGENRVATLSLKLCLQRLMAERLQATPILLLDDVTSDLDETRTNLLVNAENDGQVFVTGTRIPESYQDYSIYEIKDGKMIRRNA